MILIDGSHGEGGGQIVRSSLALAMLCRRPLTIVNIRARRSRPGLMRQHVTAVEAAARVSSAEVRGASIGSSQLVFHPGPVRGGDYFLDIGTAGSTTLVLQTVLPALLLADEPSTVRLQGGTHNPLAPPYEFLAQSYLPLVNQLGPHVELQLKRCGFYPAGGGKLTAQVMPNPQLAGLRLEDRGALRSTKVRALVARLPVHIAARECATIAAASGWNEDCFEIVELHDTQGPGNVVLITVASEHVTEVFAGFGQKGVRAERVAERAWQEASAYLATSAPVGPHLADQLLLPLGIAADQGRCSVFRTYGVTDHTRTHVEILQRFLDIDVTLDDQLDGTTTIQAGPKSAP